MTPFILTGVALVLTIAGPTLGQNSSTAGEPLKYVDTLIGSTNGGN